MRDETDLRFSEVRDEAVQPASPDLVVVAPGSETV